MHERKKKKIRKLLSHYVNILDLKDYRVYSTFRTAQEDKDLNRALAVVKINDENKVIYIKLSTFDFNKMKIREIKRYLLHELLHSFFSELSDLFDKVVEDAKFSRRKSSGLVSKFNELEHKKISHFIKLMLRLDRYKSKLKEIKSKPR